MFKTLLLAALLAPAAAFAEDVTVDNFVRAESDYNIRANLEQFKALGGDVGQIIHLRDPVTVDNQTVIRSNQDTLYSSIVLDLSEPVTITLPEIGGRYMSMHVVNQDHYMFVETKPGTYELTEDSVGTRFAYVIIRTFVDPTDPDDVEKTHAAQDAIVVEAAARGRSRRRIGMKRRWPRGARHSTTSPFSASTPLTPSDARRRPGRSIT